jgi:hypothetical protein
VPGSTSAALQASNSAAVAPVSGVGLPATFLTVENVRNTLGPASASGRSMTRDDLNRAVGLLRKVAKPEESTTLEGVIARAVASLPE